MSEQIDIDGVKFKIGYDSKAVADGLKNDEKKAEESGKKAGQSWGNAFGAVAGALAGAKIVSTFKEAFDAANKLEKTMLGLEATAKLTGNSFEQLKKQVLDLSKDGVMGLDQAATSMKTLAAQGFSADKAFQLLEASKKVSAFNNIVGDAGQGVQDFIKFLQTGSAELAENMDPSIIKVVKSLGGYAKVSSDATAKQKLINAVIEKGTKLTEDYQKFLESSGQSQVRFGKATEAMSQALGKGLQPILSKIYNVLTEATEAFTKWFGSLSQTSKAVILIGAALTTLVPIIASAIGALGALALNPVTLAIMAVVAGVTALTFAIVKMEREMSKGIALVDEQKKLKSLVEELKKTKSGSEELADAQRKLDKVTQQLNETFGETLKILRAENAEYEKKIELVARIEAAENKLGGRERVRGLSDAELEAEIQKARSMAGGATSGVNIGGRTIGGSDAFSRATAAATGSTVGGVTFGGEGENMILDASTSAGFSLAVLEAERKRRGKGGKVEPVTTTGKASPEFRFIKARDELKKLEDEYKAYLRRTSDAGLRAQAEEKLNIERQAVTKQLRGSIAEYIEDRYTAEKLAIDAQRDQQIANVRELVNSKAIGEKEAEKKIQQIREANARKTAQIQAESFSRTMQAASATASGFQQLMSARSIGGFFQGSGSTLSGLSQFSPALKALGPLGQGIGAAGSVVSTLTSLFGKSEEQRAREAEQQKRRDEEARAILELQANYQKSMLAIQEAAAKLPFENLQRQMRLADISGQQRKLAGEDSAAVDASVRSQKLALAQGTLSSESGRIGGGQLFGGVGSTPDELIRFLSERAAQSSSIAAFNSIANSITGLSGQSFGGGIAYFDSIINQLESLSGSVPPELVAAVLPKMRTQRDGLRAWYDTLIDKNSFVIGSIDSGYTGRLGLPELASLTSEISSDVSSAENLLSVIEQSNTLQLEISANTKKTAENTSKALELRPDRERSFIDVGQGYIQSLGQRISGMSVARRLGEQNFQLPSGIGSASGVTTAARTVQELTADLLSMNAQQNDTMIDILQDVRAGIIELVAVLDANPNTVSGLSVSEFTRIQSEINRRRR